MAKRGSLPRDPDPARARLQAYIPNKGGDLSRASSGPSSGRARPRRPRPVEGPLMGTRGATPRSEGPALTGTSARRCARPPASSTASRTSRSATASATSTSSRTPRSPTVFRARTTASSPRCASSSTARLPRGRDPAAPLGARRRDGEALLDPPQRARHVALPAHRAGALPQAAGGGRLRSRLRDRAQLPERGGEHAPQPRVHDARVLHRLRDLRGADGPHRGRCSASSTGG